MAINIKNYGWLPDHPDKRDRLYQIPAGASFPQYVDLRSWDAPIYNQAQLGSCTANAIAGALQMLQNKNHIKWKFTPSRLFIYYNERDMEGTVPYYSGAYIRDGIKTVNTLGACPEDSNPMWSWSYGDDLSDLG